MKCHGWREFFSARGGTNSKQHISYDIFAAQYRKRSRCRNLAEHPERYNEHPVLYNEVSAPGLGSISGALSCLTCVPPREVPSGGGGGGARAPFRKLGNGKWGMGNLSDRTESAVTHVVSVDEAAMAALSSSSIAFKISLMSLWSFRLRRKISLAPWKENTDCEKSSDTWYRSSGKH